MGRIELVLGPDGVDWEQVRDRVARVFGIGNFARAGRAPLDVDAIAPEILKDLGAREPGDVPRVGQARRQALSAESPEIEREVGGRIKEARGLARRSRATRSSRSTSRR